MMDDYERKFEALRQIYINGQNIIAVFPFRQMLLETMTHHADTFSAEGMLASIDRNRGFITTKTGGTCVYTSLVDPSALQLKVVGRHFAGAVYYGDVRPEIKDFIRTRRLSDEFLEIEIPV